MLRRSGGIISLVESVRGAALRNLDAWLAEPDWSEEDCFDNLALGGAAIENLWNDTFDVYWPQVGQYQSRLQAGGSDIREIASDIFSLWYALNACFVLNPSRREGTPQSSASPIEQAAARTPDLLLINIGSNEGLFRGAFGGHYDQPIQDSLEGIPGKMEELARRLRDALPAHTRICVNSLVRPRCVPNLMPRRNFAGFPGDSYFQEYMARIGDGSSPLSSEEMREFDEQVRTVNADVRARMSAVLGSRSVYADLYAACDAFDGKHYANRAVPVPSVNKRLRNYPLDAVFGFFNSGGMTGLDNMHPTVPGYAIIANAVLQALGSGAKISIDDAYAADTLLNDIPLGLGSFVLSLGVLGSLGLFRS